VGGAECTDPETDLTFLRPLAEPPVPAGVAGRRWHSVITRATAIMVVAVLAGCAGGLTRKDRLDYTLRAYERSIRWSQFDAASGFEAGGRAAVPDRLQRIKVTSYDVVESTLADDKERAQQTVRIRYYDTDDMRERIAIDHQDWRYDTAKEKWVLQSGLPPF
jgi:hypothetical protein